MRANRTSAVAAAIVLLAAPVWTAQGQGGGRGARAARAAHGSVCAGPAERAAEGRKALGNPAGGDPVSVYSVSVGGRPAVPVSGARGAMFSGLSLRKRHLVKIYGDGKLVHSFRFKFSDYADNNLCLWFNSLYESWSLWEAKEGRGKCLCAGRAGR
jgi:hypothetical protein